MFLDQLSKAVTAFGVIARQKKVKLFSHLDADGLCSASILVKMMLRHGIDFEVRIVKQMISSEIERIEVSENDLIIFVDLGSGQLDRLQKFLGTTQVFILDHHDPIKINHINLFHLNPLVFGEEGISSSMISYLFAKSLDATNGDQVGLALVGAVGDEQDEKWEFKGMARDVLKEGEEAGIITVTKGMRIYGRNSRPLHKALANSFDPFIPEVSGDESAAVQFLSDMGISVKDGGEWKRLSDLTVEDQQKLASSIIIQRMKIPDATAEDIFGESYTLIGRVEELQDAREFATILNACGRMGRYDIAIRLCLNDTNAVALSSEMLEQYRKVLSESLQIFRSNPGIIEKTQHASYLVFGSLISDTVVGTVTSIALNSGMVDVMKPVFGMVNTDDSMVKVSARVNKEIKNINLRDIVLLASKQSGGEGGGHKMAAGGLIPRGKEKEFIQAADKVIKEQIS